MNETTRFWFALTIVLALAFSLLGGWPVGAEPIYGVKISEVHPLPVADVNGDGRINTGDAFVELSIGDSALSPDGLLRLVTERGEIFWRGEISPAHPAVIFDEIFSGYSGWIIMQIWEETEHEVLDEREWEYCSYGGSWTRSCGLWSLSSVGSPGEIADCGNYDTAGTLVRISSDGWVMVENGTDDWLRLGGWSITAPLCRRFFFGNPVAPHYSIGLKVLERPNIVRLWNPFAELVQEVRIDWEGQPGESFDYYRCAGGDWTWSESPVPSQLFSTILPLVLN